MILLFVCHGLVGSARLRGEGGSSSSSSVGRDLPEGFEDLWADVQQALLLAEEDGGTGGSGIGIGGQDKETVLQVVQETIRASEQLAGENHYFRGSQVG